MRKLSWGTEQTCEYKYRYLRMETKAMLPRQREPRVEPLLLSLHIIIWKKDTSSIRAPSLAHTHGRESTAQLFEPVFSCILTLREEGRSLDRNRARLSLDLYPCSVLLVPFGDNEWFLLVSLSNIVWNGQQWCYTFVVFHSLSLCVISVKSDPCALILYDIPATRIKV